MQVVIYRARSAPVPRSPDGYRLYVKVTQPFHFGHLRCTKARLYQMMADIRCVCSKVLRAMTGERLEWGTGR